MSLIWRLLDPLLLKIRSRLEHLDRHFPSSSGEDFTRTLGIFESSTIVGRSARVQSLAARERLRIGAFTWIEGSILMLTESSQCTIGDYSFLGERSRLWVQTTTTIGNYVLIAPSVDVFDS